MHTRAAKGRRERHGRSRMGVVDNSTPYHAALIRNITKIIDLNQVKMLIYMRYLSRRRDRRACFFLRPDSFCDRGEALCRQRKIPLEWHIFGFGRPSPASRASAEWNWSRVAATVWWSWVFLYNRSAIHGPNNYEPLIPPPTRLRRDCLLSVGLFPQGDPVRSRTP